MSYEFRLGRGIKADALQSGDFSILAEELVERMGPQQEFHMIGREAELQAKLQSALGQSYEVAIDESYPKAIPDSPHGRVVVRMVDSDVARPAVI